MLKKAPTNHVRRPMLARHKVGDTGGTNDSGSDHEGGPNTIRIIYTIIKSKKLPRGKGS